MGARVVATEPLVLAVARDHPLARRKTIAITDLRDAAMITLVPGSGLRAVLEHAGLYAGFSPRITAETGELTSLVELVSAGLGLALLPRSAATGAVHVLRISRPRLERRTALAWNTAAGSPAARAFLAIAERHFAVA